MAPCLVSIAPNRLRSREPLDEMYWENMGRAADLAIQLGLILFCAMAAIGILVDPSAEIRVTDAAFFSLGIFQLLLGALFAWQEGMGACADD